MFTFKPSYPETPGFKTGGASHEAAAMMDATGCAVTIRVAVLKHLQKGNVETAEQIAVATGKPLHSVRSRLTELMECGLVAKLESRGEGSHGVAIHMWEAV